MADDFDGDDATNVLPPDAALPGNRQGRGAYYDDDEATGIIDAGEANRVATNLSGNPAPPRSNSYPQHQRPQQPQQNPRPQHPGGAFPPGQSQRPGAPPAGHGHMHRPQPPAGLGQPGPTGSNPHLQRPGAPPQPGPTGSNPQLQRPGALPQAGPTGSNPHLQRPGAPPQPGPTGSNPQLQRPGALPQAGPTGSNPQLQRPGALPQPGPTGSNPQLQRPGGLPQPGPTGSNPQLQGPGAFAQTGTQMPGGEPQAPSTTGAPAAQQPFTGSAPKMNPGSALHAASAVASEGPGVDTQLRRLDSAASGPLSGSHNFFSMPSGTERSASRPTVSIVARSVVGSLAVGVVASAVVAYLAVNLWLEPSRTLAWTFVGVTAPALLLGVIAAWPKAEAGWSRRNVLSGIGPALVVGLAFTILSSVWAIPHVRGLFVGLVPNDVNVLLKVWEEPNPDLAMSSCERLLPYLENPDWRQTVLGALTQRPGLAQDCTAQIVNDEARSLSAVSLASRWHRQLLTAGSATPDEQCEMAAGIAALPLPQTETDARLFTCVLAAEDESAQTCCAAQLTSADKSQMFSRLRTSLELARAPSALSSLFAMAFHSQNISEAQKAFGKEAGFQDRSARRVTLRLGCDALLEQNDTTVVAHLIASLPKDCAIEQANAPDSFDAWAPVCSDLLDEINGDKVTEPAEILCDTAQRSFKRGAIEAARSFMRHSMASMGRRGLATKIASGHHMENADKPVDSEKYLEQLREQERLIQIGVNPGVAASMAGLARDDSKDPYSQKTHTWGDWMKNRDRPYDEEKPPKDRKK